VVLSSPYLKMGFEPPPLKVLGARVAGLAVPWLPVATGLKMEDLSRDSAWQESTRKDPLYNQVTTPRWFTESGKAQAQALLLGPQLTQPLFLLMGSEDSIASPAASRTFFETVGSQDKRLREYAGMRHECLNELGKEEVLRDISNWISSHL
jgi:lysophospholipase